MAFIAAGAAASHSIIGDVNGVCYTWGRNEVRADPRFRSSAVHPLAGNAMHPHSFATCHCVGLPLVHSCLPGRTAPPFTPLRPPQKGQLGLGDAINRNNPTIVPGLRGKKVVGGSAGRNHSAVITATGESYTFGLNQYGQLGTGSVKKVKSGEDTALTPQLVSPAGGMGCDAAQSARCMALGTPAVILSSDTSAHCWRSTSFTLPPPLCQAVVSKCSKVGCGVDFTMWLCDGKVWSAGCPQYGQLGHGTDNSYNAGGWPHWSSTMMAACGGTVGLQEGGVRLLLFRKATQPCGRISWAPPTVAFALPSRLQPTAA